MPQRFKKWSIYTTDKFPLGYAFARTYSEAFEDATKRWSRAPGFIIAEYSGDRGALGWLAYLPPRELPPWQRRRNKHAKCA